MSLRIIPVIVAAGVGSRSDPMQIEGTQIAVREATASFSISIEGGFPLGPIERGDKIKVKYKGFQLVNLTAAALTVLLAVGDDDLQDDRPVNKPLIPAQAQNLFNGVFEGTGVPAASTVICAGDIDRIEVIIQAYSANVGAVVLRSAAFSRIVELTPGQLFRFEYRAGLTAGAFVAGQGLYLSETKY